MQRIGLIAGNGIYPELFIKEAHKRSVEVFSVALLGEAEEKFVAASDSLEWINIGKVGKIISAFKKNNIEQVCLCGQVKHKKLFTEIKLDFRALSLLNKVKDKRADSLLSAFCEELEKEKISVLPSITYLENYLVKKGKMSKRSPSKQELSDIEFGKHIATEIARLDIGQTVVVKNSAVISIEGFEGTDECILRAAKYGGKNTCLIKVARPSQDMRYDIPVFGPRTIETMIKAQTYACALSADKTLILDYDNTLKLADENKIAIWGI